MTHFETLENIYGEIADVYENADGTATIILDCGDAIPVKSTEKAINILYKNGFRF